MHFSSADNSWSTPQDLFDVLDAEFHFTLDVCATEQSAKCARYFTPAIDAFAQPWPGVCWMNPPYGREIGRWMERAFHAPACWGALVVCLVPARTDTRWWWDYASRAEVRFLRGRLKFGGHNNSAPFPSALVVMRLPRRASTRYWEWSRPELLD